MATLLLACSLSCDRAASPPEGVALEQLLPGAFEPTHYGCFMAGKRVGWVRVALRRLEASGEYEIERVSQFDLVTGGQPTRSQRREIQRYAASAPHRLLFGESTAIANGATTIRTLAPGDEGLELRTQSGNELSHMAVGATAADLTGPLDAMRRMLDGELGASASYFDFEFDSGRDGRTTMRNAGRSRERIDGADVELTRIEMTSDGDGGSAIFVTPEGRVERIVNGSLSEARRMDEAAATAPAEVLETMLAFDVPLEGLEGPPWDIGHLELEWRGSDALMPERDFQRARWLHEHELQLVALDRAPRPSEAERETRIPDDVAVELAPDPSCESDHPRLRQLAAEVVASRSDPWDATVAIISWICGNVSRSFASNRTTALGVLEARAGDCTEHTLLACALLRASGVPARRVNGVAYVGADNPVLGYHAWVEVWIGRWIPVDPTWGQAPADATHVCFGGERDSRIISSGAMSARATKIERR